MRLTRTTKTVGLLVLTLALPGLVARAEAGRPDYERDPRVVAEQVKTWAQKWPLENERAQGAKVVQELDKAYGLVEWPEQLERIRTIVNRLAAASDRPDVQYDVGILNVDVPNAMAITGGYIRVTKGLLDMVQSDDELAGVLAHEIAHNCLYHGLRQADRDAKWQKWELIGIIVGLVGAGVSGNTDMLNVLDVVTLSMLARVGVLSSYSRTYEREADWNGLRYMHGAGYDPTGFYTFMERLMFYELQQGLMLPEGDPRSVWDTHPLTRQRLSEILSYYREQGLPFNRAAVCKGFVATVHQVEVAKGVRIWEVRFGGRVVFQLPSEPVGGVPAEERAWAIADKINDLVGRRGISVAGLGLRSSSGIVTLHQFAVLEVKDQDAALVGLTKQEYAEEVYKAFRAAVYAAEQASRDVT